MTRTLTAKHKAAMVAGRRRKAEERRREREERLRHLGLAPVKRLDRGNPRRAWCWHGRRYDSLDDMIRAVLAHFADKDDS